jgi:dipeptidyl aminopeptidase/acylaminoacyl peptidase
MTHDGVARFGYGKMPDGQLLRVLSDTRGFALPLYGIEWAPDSRHVIATRVDERAVPDYPFLQLAPYDGDRRPRVTMVRSPLSGQERPPIDVAIVDTAAATVKHLPVGPLGLSTVHYWDPSGKRFVALQGGEYTRSGTLYEVAVPSGTARKVASENSKTFLQSNALIYDEPAFRFLAASNEMIWFSQRDGWNHLYLVDMKTGAFKPITRGDWNVQNILRVDEKARRIYFTGAGRERGENPYWRHLYVASLDGSDAQKLTGEPADHAFPPVPNALFGMLFGRASVPPAMLAPSGRYFVDTISTVNQPTSIVLKRIDGGEVMKLEAADISAATAIGFVLPEPFSAKAADGKTDLYGWILRPPSFDAGRRYPVIDAIYNGPQVVTTPHDFAGATRGFASDARAMAQLGFVVVMLDSRGTPMRSKAFQDQYYNNLGEFGLEDHVAAIKEISTTRPWMDLDRVGLYGHSFGGYAAMKGILGYPDFYKASAASAGPYDLFGMYSLETFFEPAIYKNGGKKPTGPADRPTNWGKYDLTQDAANLKGKLLLGYGDLDENAWPAVTARMVNALIAANKSFDLLYMPNRPHAFSQEGYFIRRRWDFFVRNLAGKEPPVDYAFGAVK